MAPHSTDFADLITQLGNLREEIINQGREHEASIEALPAERRASARNLVHYLAMRNRDLRPLQEHLVRLGLSSIGRAEAQVLPTLDALLLNLNVLSGRLPPPESHETTLGAFNQLADRPDDNTIRLLGQPPRHRRAYILVTMPGTAADDYMMVHRLIESGADCLRINCAHDGPETWARIIEHKRHAERALGRSCRVLMDLAGPKLRTGALKPDAGVLKIRPRRDPYGKLVRPARIWLSPEPATVHQEQQTADACLPVDEEWLTDCERGDRVKVTDARGKRRTLRIIEGGSNGCWAEARKTLYIVNGSELTLVRTGKATAVAGLPPRASRLALRCGDTVMISGTDQLGKPAFIDPEGRLLSPGRISLPIPEVYRDVRPGEPIGFDDGRISGIVERCEKQALHVRITHTRKTVERLAADKGVNLPDTTLGLPALSDKDLRDLPFIAQHGDIVALSFTNTPADVAQLRTRLTELGREDLGLVVKIETKRGFYNLPGILFEALRFPACGVMIARGDLAAECGFERLAEVQEQILWICESAHVPVIWATQVLEGLTKRGHATRAEISDAAMSQAAECVMLNKGPYITNAVRTLDDILRRMQDHQTKKRSMLRRLKLAAEFLDPTPVKR